MLAIVGVTCHCLEKNPQKKDIIFSASSSPSTFSFCIGSAKTVYSITCLRQGNCIETGFHQHWIKGVLWEILMSLGVIDSSLQASLPKSGLPGIISCVKTAGFPPMRMLCVPSRGRAQRQWISWAAFLWVYPGQWSDIWSSSQIAPKDMLEAFPSAGMWQWQR